MPSKPALPKGPASGTMTGRIQVMTLILGLAAAGSQPLFAYGGVNADPASTDMPAVHATEQAPQVPASQYPKQAVQVPEQELVPPEPAAADVPDEEQVETAEVGPEDVCRKLEGETHESWLDRAQETVYVQTCATAAWFDGFFGDNRYDAASSETYGRVALSNFWDQRDGLDAKLRFRARFALPALHERSSLLLGRGDERELIEERSDGEFDSLPSGFDRLEDDSLLVGLGYGRGGIERGFRYSVGVKMGTPLEPYVKATYRRAWRLSERDLLRVRPVAYWRSQEGLGTTLDVDLDHLIRPELLLRFSNWGNVTQDEEIDGLAWGTSLTLYQGLSDRRALTYRALLTGETLDPVRVKNYGYELRYRQRILRKWLFIEFLASVTWPKDLPEELRTRNLGAGIGLEMYFGPIPEVQMR